MWAHSLELGVRVTWIIMALMTAEGVWKTEPNPLKMPTWMDNQKLTMCLVPNILILLECHKMLGTRYPETAV